MLLSITDYNELDSRKLMDLYREGNVENAEYFYPDIEDRQEALRKAEDDFLQYIENEFFPKEQGTYWILEKDGVWVSALRTYPIEEGLFYIEALETRAEYRRMGYASELLEAVKTCLKAEGPFRLCDCVSKKNEPSVRTHLRCGFRIVSEEGFDYIAKESDSRDYGFEYRYPADS
ncbi:MAG: GNAT family N-acetyltransferase [Oscillospiraceae bacterium]|nr:GNAT family N-acetyltransferase [Oscillospiraceae bacterium]